MRQFIARILRRCGVDRAIAYTVLGRAWMVLAGLVTVLMITRYMSADDQGYYYTFASIVALQVFFELGLGYVILQFASHEKAHLTWTNGGLLDGSREAWMRLASLAQLALKWYAVAAGFVIVLVIPAGLLFMSHRASSGGGVNWVLPWVLLGLGTAGSLLTTPLFALIEGCGQVAFIALLRSCQALLSSATVWIALALGLKLYAAPAACAASLVLGLPWLAMRYGRLFKELYVSSRSVGGAGMHWGREIWPFQWRIAVSWLSGYFVFNLFTPVLFAFQGPVVAGRMGMSVSIAGAVSVMGIAWLSTKAPRFGELVALRDWASLDVLFFRALRQSLAVTTAIGLAAVGLVAVLDAVHAPLSDRLLPSGQLALLLGGTVLNIIVYGEASYLRAHKREPFVWLSVASGLCIATTTLVLGRLYGAPGILIGNLAVGVGVGLLGGTAVFVRKRRDWHAAA